METWGVVFLAVIALSSLVQAAFLIGLARAGMQLVKRVDGLHEQIERDIKPTLDQVSRISRNVGEVTDLVVLQARRLDDTLADTLEKFEATTSLLRNFVQKPLGPVADLLAFFKGLRKGLDVYRQLGGFESAHRGHGRSYSDDEHLFI